MPDINARIGVGIGQISTRQSVGLCDGEAVLQDHNVADAETVACIRAADRDAHVTRAVALLGREVHQPMTADGGWPGETGLALATL